MPRSVKKGPFVDAHLLKKVEQANATGSKKSHQDLVKAFDNYPGNGRVDFRHTQWQEIYPGFHHREHGGAQAGRVQPDKNISRSFRRPKSKGGKEVEPCRLQRN